jgi:ubiquinone biosynthesis protein
MWVTLARLCSLRTDMLGVQFCQELACTRDRAAPIPLLRIRHQIDLALAKVTTSFAEVFAEFDEQPLATRSFGQFHKARLKQNGRQVVVRVRAPDAVERAKTDWWSLRFLFFFMKQLGVEPSLHWDDLLFEVKKSADDLLDFRTEVTKLRRVGRILHPHRVTVPVIYGHLCTEEMMITEYIQGVSVSDLQRLRQVDEERCAQWMRDNEIDGSRIWRRLFDTQQELLFEHNIFYTWLEPSCVLLLRKNRMAFVSLNTCGTLEAQLLRDYRSLYQALLASDYTKACDTYLAMGPALPYKDLSVMRGSMQRALRKWESRTHIKGRSYHDKSLSSALGEIARCATEHELPAFWSLARLQLSGRTVEESLAFFDSTKNSIKCLKRYERSAQLRVIKRATTKDVRKRIDNAVDVAQLTMQLAENFQHDAEYLRRRLLSAQSKVGKVSQSLGRIFMLVGKFALIGLAIQSYLYAKSLYNVSVPLAEQGDLGRFLATLNLHGRAAWITIVTGLFYFRRVLRNLARQLFQAESGPST